jgi:hypothetical protein
MEEKIMSKMVNPTKVITGKDTRWSYCNAWEAKSINGGTPKFSVSLIIPKKDTVTVNKIKAAIEAAYREGESKLKGNGKAVPELCPRSRRLFVTATPSVRMMRRTRIRTSSMRTPPRHLASWMLTARRFSIIQ